MELREIQEIALNAYEAGGSYDAADLLQEDGKPLPWVELQRFGDTLACFVVLEISELYDRESMSFDQLQVSASAIYSAIGQLERVAGALDEKVDEVSTRNVLR